ncbi:MAG TPA: (d)CMP kinase [Gammaproteobacteria bacterium]|nr:(d)CMP kinase [Gammaproteobacteria bacterium]
MEDIPVITIDGLSGSGKGTISKMLCLELGWNILDSGALYRTLAYLIEQRTIAIEDFETNRKEIQEDFQVTFGIGSLGEPVNIFLKGQDITDLVRTEKIAEKTSLLSSLKEIRDFVRPHQREFKKPPGLIADGRDMGTVIFPEADLKIFLIASLEERAKRRQSQLKRLGSKVNMPLLLEELEARDRKDKERKHSPLKPAEDSIVIDTTGVTPEKVFGEIMSLPFNF